MADLLPATPPVSEPPRRHEVKLRGFHLSAHIFGLGGVQVELSPRRTVLVGLNGAGKSAILEHFDAAVHRTLGELPDPSSDVEPREFALEAEVDGRTVHYGWNAVVVDSPKRGRPSLRWAERCTVNGTSIWEVADGAASGVTASGEAWSIPLPAGLGLFAVSLDREHPVYSHVEPLRNLLLGVSMIRAGVPRHGPRTWFMLQRKAKGEPWLGHSGEPRLESVVSQLVRLQETHPTRLTEIEQVGRRLGVWHTLHLSFLGRKNDKFEVISSPQEFDGPVTCMLDTDGENAGMLSDGTQRIMEIVLALLREGPGLLLLEEPETSLHPGLLRKLFAEIDSYSDNQIIISTQSPSVVTRNQPWEIRLVNRRAHPMVRSLSDGDLERLHAYLDEDGTLGDFVYGGGAFDDGEDDEYGEDDEEDDDGAS